MIKNSALITIVEGNNNHKADGIRDEGFFHAKQYEQEAIAMFHSWRMNAGDYANIPIYALCVNKNRPSDSVLAEFDKLNVIYVEEYLPEVETYTCGYWNTPLGCMWLEDNVPEDFLIHIDLDMLVLKPLTDDLLRVSRNAWAKVGIIPKPENRLHIESYEHTFYDRTINPAYAIKFNTCFITSNRKRGFYKLWYHALKELCPSREACGNDRVYSQWEEHVLDVLYYEGGVKLDLLDKFEIGYSWDRLDTLTDDEVINKVFFQHDHLGTPGRNLNMKSYVQRMLDITKRNQANAK